MNDALSVVTPEAIFTMVLMGLIVGYLTVRGIDPLSVLAGVIRVGAPFFAIMLPLRAVEGSEKFWAWIGVFVLFLCYAVGTAVGLRLRRMRGASLL
jgi:hypothetical protein